MIRLTEILSNIAEAPAPTKSPIDLAFYNVDGKLIVFKSQEHFIRSKENFIRDNVSQWGMTAKEAERDFQQSLTPIKDSIEEEVFGGKKIPQKYWVSKTIQDPKLIQKFYESIYAWKQESDIGEANFLARNKEMLDRGRNMNPEVFAPDVKPGTMVYRGLKSISSKTKSFIKKSDWKDWKRTEFKAGKGENDYWYTHEGFTYAPHLAVQSFTYDPKVIFSGEFYDSEDSVIISKPLDDEFYFSNKFLEWINDDYFGNEYEVLRLGKEGQFQMLATGRTIRTVKGQKISKSDWEKMQRRDNPNYDPKAEYQV